MSYCAAFKAWREEADDWGGFTRHAFVEGLRDEYLAREAFLNYVGQDYVFLVHFSLAWALGVVKGETLDEMKTGAGTVGALVKHEMQ